MSKVPVSEAAEILGVTKEAVYNRIRRGTLKTFEKDGVKIINIHQRSWWFFIYAYKALFPATP